LLAWLAVAGVAFAGVLGALALAARLGLGPIGPFPGGKLSGKPAAPVSDWGALLEGVSTIAVEVGPDAPYSVTTSYILQDGRLYLPCGSCARKTWPERVAADDRVVLLIRGELYPRRAIRLTEPGRIVPLVRDIDGARDGGKLDLSTLTTWYFRIDPR
jgi:hypothetical protein